MMRLGLTSLLKSCSRLGRRAPSQWLIPEEDALADSYIPTLAFGFFFLH
jgi:hypothetical protein